MYTHSTEQLLAVLPPPPHVRRHQILPLLSECTQTTAHLYENTDFTTSLSAHRYADTPLYVNTSPSKAPLSQAIAFGQSNVTDVPNLYAQSYTFDAQHSSGLVALDQNIARSSYADNSQRLPIVIEQPGFSAFSRVEVPYSRPTTVQYTVGTSAITSTAPLQSPSVHWRKRLAYDYVQPDIGPGAPTHVAPAIHSGYIGPQTSDAHTHTHTHTIN